MKLVSEAQVREALGFEDMTDITLAIRTILPAVTASLEVALDTSFELSTAQEDFYVPPHKGPDVNGHMEIKLRLNNGFIAPGTCVVTSGMTSQSLVTEPISIQTMTFRSYKDIEKGVLFDNRTFYAGTTRRLASIDYLAGPYIRVAYTYGFDVEEGDPELYDQARVPQWLKDAAIIQSQMFLSGHPILKNAESVPDTDYLTKALRALLLSHQRFVPGSLIPM